jgi:hypothetical protein
VGPVRFHKKHTGTRYAKFLVLHLVGAAGHVVHSGASGVQNIDALLFMLGWDWYGFEKKARWDMLIRTCVFASDRICGSPNPFRCLRDAKQRHTFFCIGGTGTDLTESESGHVTPNLCFCIRWDLRVAYCIPVHSGRETSTHYFSCSGGTTTDLTKSAPRHVTPNLYFYNRWDPRVT